MAVVLFLISMGGHVRAWLRCKCSDYFCGRQQMKLIDGSNRFDNQVKMLFSDNFLQKKMPGCLEIWKIGCNFASLLSRMR
jgi:hypothetical protein